MRTTAIVGKRGTLVLPAAVRKRVGLTEGTLVTIDEEPDGGLRLRPAAALPIEIYSPERRAELLLENAVDASDYQRARRLVRALGLDPDAIPHERP
jgi:AbrB family looped-hinge helix DNA binding protein